ncbi:vacuolar protein sorting-associated protein 54 [Anthonomus grandis grandis]|uniref:vacuolar protein sorting-associated protein 54 n=1 Tax=Anthonomus grandis grandis TaxID=2921223 RepID=UPI0021660D8A|nr:vacuolar protein sorting-associated protein 54 [Anthonomus grandis grandis]
MNGAGEEPWTLYKASQYLPAVLSDPHKGKQLNFFTRTWGDSFVERSEIERSPFLPEITYAHFEQYLKKYGKRCRRHVQLKQLGLKDKASDKSGQQQQQQQDKLGLIPSIYMQNEFRLSDPKVFSEVFELGDSKTEHDLQDELSHYLDIVEEQIAKQVSQKSGAFFHAMTSHDTIMEQMGQACGEVRTLRAKVQQVDKCLTSDPLKLLARSRSKNNHKQLLDKLKLMSTVLQTQPTLQLLLSSSDYVGALELISSTQEVLAKELAGVTSLRHLPSQLKEMSKLIDKMLSSEFERYAAADLHPPCNDIAVLEQERLVSLVAGLLRQNNLQFLEAYRQEAITASQAAMKQLMIEQLADAEDELNELTGSGEVAPSMDSAHWINVLRLGSEALGKIMYRVKSVHDVIKEVAEVSSGQCTTASVSNMDRFISLEEYNRVSVKLRLLLTSVCDYCSERLAALVSQQSEKSSVTSSQVADLANIVEQFAKQCESICGKPGSALKAAFKIQAANYAHKFHLQRKTKLTILLEAERWKSAQVPPEIQQLVDELSTGEPLTALRHFEQGEAESRAAPTLRAGSQHYVTVGTCLILVRLVAEYCVCAYDLKLTTPLVVRHLTELLRTFNTRACQLVLGAGALRTAGLKTITSTNLALASRSLQLLLWLIPLVRGIFKRLSSGHEESFSALDNVEKDIGNHVNQLEAKVLSIMNMLLGEQLNEWEAKPPVPSKQFRNVSRHLTKLHEAVSAVLPEEQISDIYQEIHKNFKTRLREQIIKMNVQNNGGPQHGLVTTEIIFYLQTMKMLKVLPDKFVADRAMDDVWDK